MPKSEFQFSDFFLEVPDKSKDFVAEIHKLLTSDGYNIKIESKASGFLVSYAHPKTKHSILNFVFRKKGIYIRLYGANCNKYLDVLNRLPQSMVGQMQKAGDCPRLLGIEKCNSRCALGYDFKIGDIHFQKCRIACFFLLVDDESTQFLLEMVQREKQERDAA